MQKYSTRTLMTVASVIPPAVLSTLETLLRKLVPRSGIFRVSARAANIFFAFNYAVDCLKPHLCRFKCAVKPVIKRERTCTWAFVSQRNGLPEPARLLPQLAHAPVGDAIGSAHHLRDRLVCEVLAAAGAARARHAQRRCVVVLDAVLAVGAFDELTRTLGAKEEEEKSFAINSH
jgi:hypothetical protein